MIVGTLVLDSVRKIFSDDRQIVRRLFREQPVTMIAATTTVGSVIVWGVLAILGL